MPWTQSPPTTVSSSPSRAMTQRWKASSASRRAPRPGEYLLPGLLSQFTEIYPNVRPRVAVTDSASAIAQVADGHSDLGFVGMKVAHSSFEWTVVAEDELVLAVPGRHPFAGRASVDVTELQGLPFIEREPGSGTWTGLRRALDKAGVKEPGYTPVMVVNSTHATLAAVNNGFGFSIVSSLATHEHEFDQVYPARLTGLDTARSLYMVQADLARLTRRPGLRGLGAGPPRKRARNDRTEVFLMAGLLSVTVHTSAEEERVSAVAEIIRGLTTEPKTLSPKFLYHEEGSGLFDEITRLEEYYPTRIERSLLEGFGAEIIREVRPPRDRRTGARQQRQERDARRARPGSGSSEALHPVRYQ